MLRKKKTNWKEMLIESLIYTSGTTTTIVVLLISFFLFQEGFGLFTNSKVEEGFEIVINKANKIDELSFEEVRAIFNQEITDWSEVGGEKGEINVFRLSKIEKKYSKEEIGENLENLPKLVRKSIAAEPNIIAAVPQEYIKTESKILEFGKVSLSGFLFGSAWYPTSNPAPSFGVLAIILGTLWVCLGALIFAIPVGVVVAIYLAELSSKRFRDILMPWIELLAGIPSVVYGFFGLVVIVPTIQFTFNLSVGETALAGSILLGVLSLPLIITIAEDAIRAVPKELKEASLALGATHLQTIFNVMLPHARSGILSASILGVGRTVGETMAVLMVTGNAAQIPSSFLQPVRTITATIAAELGEAPYGGVHFQSLFMLACILFIFTFLLNLVAEWVVVSPEKP